MDNNERRLRHAAAKLLGDENYALVMRHMVEIMSEALLTANPLHENELRSAALRREAMVAVVSYVQQLAEPIPTTA